MKNRLSLFLLASLTLSAAAVDERLLAYQQRYSVCSKKNDYQIAECLLNGDLNFSMFRGDRRAFRYLSPKYISRAQRQGRLYEFTMEQLPHTERYEGLKAYLDYLNTIKEKYVTPRFKGNDDEDTLRMKRIFNLLQDAGLYETPEVTPAFEEAVLEYQSRHGLAVDGDIGPRTKASLKQSIGSIITKIKKNLMIESITKRKPLNYILVNIPEFRMHFYENGMEVLSMNTVVGKPKMRTPVFSRKMQFVVLNPTWNVPPSIYRKEYAHKSTAELKKLGLRYGSNGKLYQPAGRRNALGLVKFLFPNKYNVYMHDTPAKSLFKRSRRAYSHGCIRLEKPMDLLHKLGYRYKPGKTKWNTLKHKIPVFVEYHTVWIDEEGRVQFRPDVYGYEKKLFIKPVRYKAPRKKVIHRDVLSDF